MTSVEYSHGQGGVRKIHPSWLRIAPGVEALWLLSEHAAMSPLAQIKRSEPDTWIHGPENLDWTRADCACVRWTAEDMARETILSGGDERAFIGACREPGNDLVRHWIALKGVTEDDLAALYDAECERLEAPSVLATVMEMRAWDRKEERLAGHCLKPHRPIRRRSPLRRAFA